MALVDWVGAGIAGISAIGAGLSWWRSNLSKDARRAAEDAKVATEASEARAKAMLEQAERQAAATERLAEGVEQLKPEAEGARLAVEWKGTACFTLRNRSSKVFQCEHVRNREKFVRLDLPDEFALLPGQGISGHAVGAYQMPMPDDLELDEVGADSPVFVSLAGRPRKSTGRVVR